MRSLRGDKAGNERVRDERDSGSHDKNSRPRRGHSQSRQRRVRISGSLPESPLRLREQQRRLRLHSHPISLELNQTSNRTVQSQSAPALLPATLKESNRRIQVEHQAGEEKTRRGTHASRQRRTPTLLRGRHARGKAQPPTGHSLRGGTSCLRTTILLPASRQRISQ